MNISLQYAHVNAFLSIIAFYSAEWLCAESSSPFNWSMRLEYLVWFFIILSINRFSLYYGIFFFFLNTTIAIVNIITYKVYIERYIDYI